MRSEDGRLRFGVRVVAEEGCWGLWWILLWLRGDGLVGRVCLLEGGHDAEMKPGSSSRKGPLQWLYWLL